MSVLPDNVLRLFDQTNGFRSKKRKKKEKRQKPERLKTIHQRQKGEKTHRAKGGSRINFALFQIKGFFE